jgi:glycine betaine/proline transport system permease protein
MAGLNQTLMLSLSMVVIASMIGAKGLGDPVRSGINNLQPGLAVVGGVGIVVLAIVLDRITQALGQSNPGQSRSKLWGLLMVALRWGQPTSPLPKPQSSSNVSSDTISSPQKDAPR